MDDLQIVPSRSATYNPPSRLVSSRHSPPVLPLLMVEHLLLGLVCLVKSSVNAFIILLKRIEQ